MFSEEISVLLAFSMGLFSSLHCLGMCGSIIGALSLSLPQEVRDNRVQLFFYVLAYNTGRICSYAIAGIIIAGLGETLARLVSPELGHGILAGIAALVLISVGLYITGWFPHLSRLDAIGAGLWRRLEPVGRRFMPITSRWKALAFGAIWGWLPCGLVYSALLWSASAGTALKGGLYMLAFGLGTMPAVMTAGIAVGWTGKFLKAPRVRQVLGLVLIAFGIWALLQAVGALPHSHHGHHQHAYSSDNPCVGSSMLSLAIINHGFELKSNQARSDPVSSSPCWTMTING